MATDKDSRVARSVAVVSHDASRTGAPIALLTLVQQMAKADDWSPMFFMLDGGPLLPEFADLGPCRVVPRLGRFHRRLTGRLLEVVTQAYHRKHFADWLTSLPNPTLVYLNTITTGHLARVARRRGIPVVTHVHELEEWISRRVPPPSVEGAIADSTLLVAASEAVRDNLVTRHGAPTGRISVVHAAIPLGPSPRGSRSVLRSRLAIRDEQVLILGVGTIDERKGVDLFVEAGIRACAQHSYLRFGWLGGTVSQAFRDDLATRVAAACREDAIRFFGESDRPDDYYGAADLFCLSSREDPYPLVMIEAAAAGLPVVGFTGTGGVDDFLALGGGVLVSHLDVDELARKICDLANDAVRRERLSEEASKNAARHDIREAARQIAALTEPLV